MSNSQPRWKRLLTSQWSFFWAGITFGVAQIIYIVGLWQPALEKGKALISTPITVTTDLGRMFRGMELWLSQTLGFDDWQLYGNSVDGVAGGGAFVPGVSWAILGMILGGWIVAQVERENRMWVKYPPRMLLISFIGGALFSYGTRLAGGCTLNHLLGGIPLMSIHSTVTVLFMAVGGAVAFYFMARVGVAPYFKHQETRAYVVNNDKGEGATYDPNYRPARSPLFWVSLTFVALFVGVAVYGGLFNPESLQHLKKGELAPFGKSLAADGWIFLLATLIAGVVAGIGMGKSGFGTECALVAAEAGDMMKKNDGFYAKLGVPRITRTLMRGYLPMIGIAASWVVMLAFVWGAWAFAGIKPGFEDGIKETLTAGSILGGALLGVGAVMLIGCEIRSYMRIGLGYLNTWVGFMGFAVGYLPFTLYYDAHNAFLKASQMSTTYKWYQLVFPDNTLAQQVMLVAWWVAIVALVVWLVRLGARNTGVSAETLLHKNTEDLQTEISREASRNGGRVGQTTAPAAVPAMA